jgi:hypothetical protein
MTAVDKVMATTSRLKAVVSEIVNTTFKHKVVTT